MEKKKKFQNGPLLVVRMPNLGVTRESYRVGKSRLSVVEVIKVTVLAVPVTVETLAVLVVTVTVVTLTVVTVTV